MSHDQTRADGFVERLVRAKGVTPATIPGGMDRWLERRAATQDAGTRVPPALTKPRGVKPDWYRDAPPVRGGGRDTEFGSAQNRQGQYIQPLDKTRQRMAQSYATENRGYKPVPGTQQRLQQNARNNVNREVGQSYNF